MNSLSSLSLNNTSVYITNREDIHCPLNEYKVEYIMGRMQSARGVFSVEEKAMAAALAEEDSSVKVWLARTCQVMNEAHCQTPLRPIIRRITVVLQTTRPSIHRAQLGRRAPPIFTSTESFSASAVISASPNLLIFNLDRTLVLSQGQSLITCSTLCPRDLSSVSAGNY